MHPASHAIKMCPNITEAPRPFPQTLSTLSSDARAICWIGPLDSPPVTLQRIQLCELHLLYPFGAYRSVCITWIPLVMATGINVRLHKTHLWFMRPMACFSRRSLFEGSNQPLPGHGLERSMLLCEHNAHHADKTNRCFANDGPMHRSARSERWSPPNVRPSAPS